MAVTIAPKPNFLEFFPLTLYASVSGFSGVSAAMGFVTWPGAVFMRQLFGIMAVGLFALITVIYVLKCIRYPQLIKKDFDDPVAVNLFGVFFISMLTASATIRRYDMQFGLVLWATGTITMGIFSWIVITRWLNHQQNPLHALPAWLIPVLGILDISITGMQYSYPAVHEICIICYVTGLLVAGILIVIIFSRLMFQPGLAAGLSPTLLLLSAPFSLSFAGYELITGRQDLIATFFCYCGIFLAILFGQKLIFCLLKVQFTVTWWSVSFPITAITVASFRYASHSQVGFVKIMPVVLLVLSLIIMLILLVQTLHYIIAEFMIKGCPKPKHRMTLYDLVRRHDNQVESQHGSKVGS